LFFEHSSLRSGIARFLRIGPRSCFVDIRALVGRLVVFETVVLVDPKILD
jgi:hypothetical protein